MKPIKTNEFYEIYEQNRNQRNSSKTRKTRISLLKQHFLEKYGNDYLVTISPKDICDIYDLMRRDQYSNNSIYGVYAALSAFFSAAIKAGYIDHSPVAQAECIRPTGKSL